MKENLLRNVTDPIQAWWEERTVVDVQRRRVSVRFLVVPRQDASANSVPFEIVHEDSILFGLYKGAVDNPEHRIVDIPKYCFTKDGKLDTTKVNIIFVRDELAGGMVAKAMLPSEE